ncbi:MAG: c-type cytochrome domain-containing protein, partial [Bacteroidota bacterium]
MSYRVFISLIFLALFVACAQETEDIAQTIPDRPDFIFDVKPLLSDRCFACHGPDEEKQKAGLALHTAEHAYAELKDKPGKFAIIPGNPEKSEIYRR